MKRRICAGLLAHVDAGKTTLSEALLFLSGQRKKLGRVDHGDAFLDTDSLERERGITIFSKQALLELPDTLITLLDTPGHADFSAEMERSLQVLDCAVLIISGTDGLQSHTLTLWKLLRRHALPVFLFINKMDLPTARREELLEELRGHLEENCLDFTAPRDEAFWERCATCSEAALGEYLETGQVSEDRLRELIAHRELFPCWFGSALKLEGVEDFLAGLERYAPVPTYGPDFGARVYKISRDEQGTRLSWLKITGGTLQVRDTLTGGSGEEAWAEKVHQIRLYSGARFESLPSAPAGTLCCVTGLSHTRPGQGLGAEGEDAGSVLEPVLGYRLLLPPGCEVHSVLPRLLELAEEDPLLHLVWQEESGEIHLQLMGEIQLEVLRRKILERFGLEVGFGPGRIVYRETIAEAVEGIGHFEPLRHYAEVHLLLEPGERGSGLVFASRCGDSLDRNWQRLVLTHLMERQHLGVLTGSPITDMRINLIAGRAHLKHTEGGDFRQATYRAVRQGLMGARSILLEPWYAFRLEVPGEQLGRAMSDLQRMGADFAPPEGGGETAVIEGQAPVSQLRDYPAQLSAYTRGRGRLSCESAGYFPCHDQEEVVALLAYQPERDLANPADSVFCAHGAGYTVPWYQVPQAAHIQTGLFAPVREEAPVAPQMPRGGVEEDKQLLEIFERTYGKVERRAFEPVKKPARHSLDEEKYQVDSPPAGPEYLLVDGYNIIFAWEELKRLAQDRVDLAREALCNILVNYRGVRGCEVILVFDAYKVKGNPGSVERYDGIYVVYTKEAETADAYIEKATYDLGRRHRVRVATSDALEQLIILGHGALRLSARSFRQEVEEAQGELSRLLEQWNRRGRERDSLKYTAKIVSRQEQQS